MLPTVKSWLKTLQLFLNALCILLACALLNAQAIFALNDGQQIVLESWSLVNQGYLNPTKFDQIHWKRLRRKALEKSISTSEEAYSAIESMLQPLGDPYTRLLRPKDFKAMKASNLGSEINGVGLQLGARNDDGQIVVIAPLEGSPAADAGIASGTAFT